MPGRNHGANEREDAGSTAERRWRLIGDVAVFQGKLLLDGLRDLVLSPVSIGAALIGIMTSPDRPGRHFYRLMHWGRWSDRAINLFNAKGSPADTGPEAGREAGGPNVDQLADELERMLVERYDRNTIARAAKNSIDRGFDRMHAIPPIDRERLRQAARHIADGLARARKTRGPEPDRLPDTPNHPDPPDAA